MIKLYINMVKMSIENMQVELYFFNTHFYTNNVGKYFLKRLLKYVIVGRVNMNKL